jgi:hypothetical protein
MKPSRDNPAEDLLDRAETSGSFLPPGAASSAGPSWLPNNGGFGGGAGRIDCKRGRRELDDFRKPPFRDGASPAGGNRNPSNPDGS